MNRSLVWFRDDLRTLDHQLLRRAAAAGPMLGVYCFDPLCFGTTRFGCEKTAWRRAQFLIESVGDLREQMRNLGGELIVRMGSPETEIGSLIDRLAIDALYFHEAIGTEEHQQACRVQSMVERRDVRLHRCLPDTLFAIEDLPFSVGDTPELFTKFRKLVEKNCQPRSAEKSPERIDPIELGDVEVGSLPTVVELGCSTPEATSRTNELSMGPKGIFHGGQSHALRRIEQYVWQNDRLRVYHQTRNGMLNVDDSSKFSPWLAHGCLSAGSLADEVKRYEAIRVANKSTYWMIFELMWRDYFRLIALKHGAKLFHSGGLRGFDISWSQDWEGFDAWRTGRTGYPLVDANMRELAATGYMSNRGRQNVGSFLTKNLGIDWRMGAEWFESQLIDHDVASNYGNWNYVAGVGNDARGFRVFNITKQSRDYDPQGVYLKHWLPELARVPVEHVHEPWKLSRDQQSRYGVRLGVDYPEPLVDLIRSARQNEETYQKATAALS